jgi:DNA-binding transcriptional LysR family regulator
MSLVWSHPLLNLWGIALDPTKDRAWTDADTAFGHHFCQIAIADPILAVPAHAQQDDLDRETAALEQRQQGGSSIGRSGLYYRGYCNSAVPTVLLRHYEAARDLVCLFKPGIRSAGNYHLLFHESRVTDPHLTLFRQWLAEEASVEREADL